MSFVDWQGRFEVRSGHPGQDLTSHPDGRYRLGRDAPMGFRFPEYFREHFTLRRRESTLELAPP